jgi:hypothetical protein
LEIFEFYKIGEVLWTELGPEAETIRANMQSSHLYPEYRRIDKYLCQPRLTNLNITNVGENYLSSAVVFLSFAYVLDSLGIRLK